MHAGAGDCNGADPSFPVVTQSSASVIEASCSANRCGAAPALQLNAHWQQTCQDAAQKEPSVLQGQTFCVHNDGAKNSGGGGGGEETNELYKLSRDVTRSKFQLQQCQLSLSLLHHVVSPRLN